MNSTNLSDLKSVLTYLTSLCASVATNVELSFEIEKTLHSYSLKSSFQKQNCSIMLKDLGRNS